MSTAMRRVGRTGDSLTREGRTGDSLTREGRSRASRYWRRAASALALVGLACVTLTACGDAGNDVAGITSTTSKASTTTIDESMPGRSATLEVSSTNLGDVLTTGTGMTLYLNTNDGTDNPTCVAHCAQTWPPFTTDNAPQGTGISPDVLGTVERPDGSIQVTAAGHPLYTYSGDSEAGDTNGEGSGGIWFAVSPSGKAIKQSPSSDQVPLTQP